MDKPKCKICGERHYGVCGETAEATRNPVTAEARTPSAPSPTPLPTAAKAEKPAYDRNAAHRAYMVEYMRRYRAKKRAEINSRPAEP